MLRPLASRHVTTSLARRLYANRRRAPPPIASLVPPPRFKPGASSPPTPPPKAKPDAGAISKSRRLPLALASIFGGVFGFYAIRYYLLANQSLPDPDIALLSHQKDVAARYDDTANCFDSEVATTEWLMGLHRTRKSLASACQGHVLEVSCGTGRNLSYFDVYGSKAKVDSLTFVDLSPQMVEVCKRKWDVLFGAKGKELKKGLVIRFLTGSALGNLPPPPASPASPGTRRKYDTIIQTMGLCSTPAPKDLLVNTAKHLDTQNDASRIYLLEHGRSYLPWLNRLLDNMAPKHAENYGCWFNRDITAMVENAAAESGLEVLRERRKHFGTTYIFELKPKLQVTEAVDAAGEKAEDTDQEGQKQKKGTGWFWQSK